MKTISLIIFTILTLPLNTLARPDHSRRSSLEHWVDQENKLVYFINKPVLKLELGALEATHDFWDQLSIDFSYSVPSSQFKQEYSKLQAEYTDYKIVRVYINGAENVNVKIPSLNINEPVDTLNGTEGPYFNLIYYIPKKKSAQVRAAFQKSDFINVTGKVSIFAPYPTRTKIDCEVNQELLK